MNIAIRGLTPSQIEARNRREKFHRSISENAAKVGRRDLLKAVSVRPAPLPRPVVQPMRLPPILVYPVIPEEAPKPVRPTMAEIVAAVAKEYRISVDDLKSQRRHLPVVLARQIAMYLCCELTSHSLPVIGRFFGDRDHTTVLHARRKIARKVYCEPHFASEVVSLGEQITGGRR